MIKIKIIVKACRLLKVLYPAVVSKKSPATKCPSKK